MKIRETDLPGIGKKYAVTLKEGRDLVIIIYNTGRREIYLMEDEEAVCVVELTDEEAKELGFLIAGAVYQPVSSEKMEIFLRQMVMEWVKVEKGSSLVGKSIAQLQIRKRTGVSVVAIDRGGSMIPSPDPYNEVIKEGDVLIVVGTRQQINSFMELCGRCSTK
ncbi:TrkA-C domain protein [Thermocrinis albus DSM 14484]|uniref:TrkA-C domain protein n=1 Tax=Thermocrinis albus (strain DSM 14484 / JCM 11386 / HI 11/12) TaxID=638303 RepID=D3SNF9_THEAH|nr:cation:proton antiporter regulatory subunit [Thermocrinis albus]ADC88696.1 TrkA-C domain protein [Thermocrinis albus DSM 14484]